MRAAFPSLDADERQGTSRWVGPELPKGQVGMFTYFDAEGQPLTDAAVAHARQVTVQLLADVGAPPTVLRFALRNAGP
jgi:hypothetical protein